MTEAIYDELAAEQAPPVPESSEDATNTEVSAEDGEKQSTGRPRPAETIERDAKVLEVMTNADTRFTKTELVEATGLPGNEVYLSLYRLGKGLEKREQEPQVVRTGRQWGVVGKEYPEPETPAEATPTE